MPGIFWRANSEATKVSMDWMCCAPSGSRGEGDCAKASVAEAEQMAAKRKTIARMERTPEKGWDGGEYSIGLLVRRGRKNDGSASGLHVIPGLGSETLRLRSGQALGVHICCKIGRLGLRRKAVPSWTALLVKEPR